jgi:hypothetical protein
MADAALNSEEIDIQFDHLHDESERDAIEKEDPCRRSHLSRNSNGAEHYQAQNETDNVAVSGIPLDMVEDRPDPAAGAVSAPP